MTFQPMVLESTEGWEASGASILKKIATAVARALGQDDNDTIKHLFGKLSIILAKTNASLILNRVPQHPDPEDNGQL